MVRHRAEGCGCDRVVAERYLNSGEIRLDTVDERLWLAGEPRHVNGKAFLLLRMLMQRPQMLVTKEEIFESVWGGLAVSDSVLTTAIKELRQALDDDARQPTLIETVHRRGYRFMTPVTASDEIPIAAPPEQKAAIPPRRYRLWLGGGLLALMAVALLWFFAPSSSNIPAALAAPAIHPKSIAVLPFRDLSAGSDQNWFAEGLTEEIQNRLIQTPDLHVISKSTAAGFREQEGSLPAKARSLGVAHILDGSVRRAEGRVRVTAKLVRTSDGTQLWSQT